MGYFKHAGAGVSEMENAGLMGVALRAKRVMDVCNINWVALKVMQIKEHAHGKGSLVSSL